MESHNHKMAVRFSRQRSDRRCSGQLYLINNCVFSLLWALKVVFIMTLKQGQTCCGLSIVFKITTRRSTIDVRKKSVLARKNETTRNEIWKKDSPMKFGEKWKKHATFQQLIYVLFSKLKMHQMPPIFLACPQTPLVGLWRLHSRLWHWCPKIGILQLKLDYLEMETSLPIC